MIDTVSSPNSNCIVPLSNGVKWELIDNDFIVDAGTPAIVTLLLLQVNIPLTDGFQFTILGKVLTIDNSLPVAGFDGLSLNGEGSSNQVLTSVSQIINNCFLDKYTTTLTGAVGGNTLSVTANKNEVKSDFTNIGNANEIAVSGTNGTDPVYSNSRIRVELLQHSSDGTLKPVLNGVRTESVKQSNGNVLSNCFDFSQTIAVQLKGNEPVLNQGFELHQGWQDKYCIRYRKETPDENCNYQNSEWQFSNPVLMTRIIKQCNDNRSLDIFCQFPQFGGDNIEYLNEYVKKCFCDTWTVLYFSGNLNCFYGGLAPGLSFAYVVCLKIPSLGVDFEYTSNDTDGLLLVPIGDYNLKQLGYNVSNGEEYTIQIKAETFLNNVSQGVTNLTDELIFKKSCGCERVQVLWEEDYGAISSMCFDYLDETSVTTEGEKVCVGRLKGGSYEDKNRRGKYSIKNKNTSRQHKLKIEKKNSRENFQEMEDFLGSENYWVIDKDRQGNDLVRKIIPDFGTTGLYKRGDLLEIIFSYSFDEKLTFSKF